MLETVVLLIRIPVHFDYFDLSCGTMGCSNLLRFGTLNEANYVICLKLTFPVI